MRFTLVWSPNFHLIHSTLFEYSFHPVFNAHDDDYVQECKMNCDMMRRVSEALNIVAPSLRSLVYSGGTRVGDLSIYSNSYLAPWLTCFVVQGYGIYVPAGTFKPPLTESLADQLPADYAQTVAYPWFRQILTEASRGRNWTWTEVCPDAVIGFSPNGSGFSLALHWAQYLSLFAHINSTVASSTGSAQVEVPFPGCEEAATSKLSPISGKMLGRISIFTALNPDKCGGKVVNMADADGPTTYGELWPKLAAWFGLVGTGPVQDQNALKPGEYIAKHQHVFDKLNLPKALTCGVGSGSAQLDQIGWWLCFDRQLSLERLRGLGFKEQRDAVDGWLEAFDQLRRARIII